MNIIIEFFKAYWDKIYLNKILENNFFEIELFLSKKYFVLIENFS